MNYTKLVANTEESIRQHGLRASDILACSAKRRLDSIETVFGNIEVIVNPYLPPDSFYLVNKKKFRDKHPEDWIDDRAPTDSV